MHCEGYHDRFARLEGPSGKRMRTPKAISVTNPSPIWSSCCLFAGTVLEPISGSTTALCGSDSRPATLIGTNFICNSPGFGVSRMFANCLGTAILRLDADTKSHPNPPITSRGAGHNSPCDPPVRFHQQLMDQRCEDLPTVQGRLWALTHPAHSPRGPLEAFFSSRLSWYHAIRASKPPQAAADIHRMPQAERNKRRGKKYATSSEERSQRRGFRPPNLRSFAFLRHIARCVAVDGPRQTI